MPRSVNAYKVFIASPGDVNEERRIVKSVCHELNSDPLVIRNDVRFEVAGWENAVSSAGRPQEIVNPLLRNTDLFVCLFHRRIGTPTASAASGTMAEFEWAYETWKETRNPHIMLFFKALESRGPNDLPGNSQMRAVKEFRERIDRKGMLLYRESKTPDEFRTIFNEQVRGWLGERIPASGGRRISR